MNNIIDYIDWRGDLTFKYSPMNEVDAVILSQIAYIDFTEIVSSLSDSAVNGLTAR